MGSDRKDQGGKLMKTVLTLANQKLQAICGLELILDSETGLAAADDETNTTQTEYTQTQATQGSQTQATQGRHSTTLFRLEFPPPQTRFV